MNNANLSEFRVELEAMQKFDHEVELLKIRQELERQFNENPSAELARQIFALRQTKIA